MRDPVTRYADISCPLDISETLCPSRVRPARQVTFHFFWPENRTRPENVSFRALCVGQDNKYLVRREVREVA
jgi:hypothetical protein